MTRLKALELFGFKSFADRTRFEFPDGITVVVGPNGSGKSNVVDAIKWVLGEQSVRSLRGRDMTDVIFAGSVSRKPLNTAETTLVFDNADRRLPVEADEVQIGRRVYRSGENEYLINGEVCRLRDVRELFSGTGAATEAYSVIEQGRVDALLLASGKERRAVFEEAAGITRFRARRTESLRRLERAEQNRQRLADIVGEVAARLETVRHQAARARRWRQMTDRLRRLRIVAAREDLAVEDAAVTAVEETLAALQADLTGAEAAAAESTAVAAAHGSEERDLAPRVESLRSAANGEREQIAAAEALRRPLRDRVEELEAELRRVGAEEDEARRRYRTAMGAASDASNATGDFASSIDVLAARLAECEKIAAGSDTFVAEARDRLRRIGARAGDLERDRQRLQREIDRAEGRFEVARRDAAGHRGRIGAARQREAAAAEALALCEGTLAAQSLVLARTADEIAAAEDEVRERSEALDSGWKELAGWQARLEACRERKNLLEEFASRHEGVAESSRLLLAEGIDTAADGPGIRGIVGESIDSPIEWAGLVDVALGTTAQAVEVGSLGAFEAWLERWSAGDRGRAALAAGGRIGVVSGDELPAPTDLELRGTAGVVERLDRLVAADDTVAGQTTARRLLARVWVVETSADARRLATEHADALFVTREGWLCSHGRLEIGTPAGTSGLVARRAELRSLVERHDELVHRAESHARTVTGLQDALQAARQAVRQLQSRRQNETEGLATARGETTRLSRERDSARESLAEAESALGEAERQATQAGRLRDDLAGELAAVDGAEKELRREREQTEQSIATSDRSRGSIVDEINRLRIELATARERLARAELDTREREAEAADRREAVEGIRRRTDQTRGRLAAAELEVLQAGARLAEAAWAAERSEEALGALRTRQAAVRDAAAVAAEAADRARSEISRLAERIHACDLEAGEARHRRARIVERIRDEYGIEIDDAAAVDTPLPSEATDTPDPDDIPADRGGIDAAIEELRRKLASMTTVNLEALAEAEQLAERLAGLEGQLADVTDAKQSIEQLIARIDEESRRLLADTIETVRGHFRGLFEHVFGGGQADILLEPDVDVLETSVEIVARPPGKEPRSISLLSGGEKTMTCVALLLAIFRSRPSPFCVLDEVDAALDEANVDRFVAVLREFRDTQIIVVTHSKKTMAAANTLYGVTMEESGVSKRVSVRFESAAAAAGPPSRAAA